MYNTVQIMYVHEYVQSGAWAAHKLLVQSTYMHSSNIALLVFLTAIPLKVVAGSPRL